MRKRSGYILLTLIILAGLVFIGQHSSNNVTLRRYIGELKNKGEKLAWNEILPSFSTNLEHAAARDIFATNKATGSFIVPQVMQFVDPGKARIGWKGKLHGEGMSTNGAVTDGITWRTLEEQNKQQAVNLEMFRVALKNPSPNLGPRTNYITGPSLNFTLLRRLAQSFLAGAMENLHQNQAAAACEEVKQIVALTKHNKEEPMLAAQMVRNAIASAGLSVTWELMQSPDLNEEMLSDLQAEWQNVNLFDALEKGFLGERAYGYEMLRKIQKSNGTELRKLFTFTPATGPSRLSTPGIVWKDIWFDRVVFPWYKIADADGDALFYLKSIQGSLDYVRMLKSGDSWSAVKPLVDSRIGRIDRTLAADRFHRYRFSELAIPNYSKPTEAVVRAETLRRLTIVAIALKRHQLAHGEFPRELKTMSSHYLVEVPIDPMSGKLVCYRLNPDGSYVLYSVGEDGRDDGGIGGKGLWSGKDAVWPMGVEEDINAEAPVSKKGK